ncbi:hypothetical protein MQM1_069 [Aeromonas phage vB_AsaP_MQM1]|nr:hypothetical protein MQM1_069 [Aeromonas phage vB_AsaP_MQM1]
MVTTMGKTFRRDKAERDGKGAKWGHMDSEVKDAQNSLRRQEERALKQQAKLGEHEGFFGDDRDSRKVPTGATSIPNKRYNV